MTNKQAGAVSQTEHGTGNHRPYFSHSTHSMFSGPSYGSLQQAVQALCETGGDSTTAILFLLLQEKYLDAVEHLIRQTSDPCRKSLSDCTAAASSPSFALDVGWINCSRRFRSADFPGVEDRGCSVISSPGRTRKHLAPRLATDR